MSGTPPHMQVMGSIGSKGAYLRMREIVTLRRLFLQGVSVAASPVLAMIGKPSVCLSVCHTLALCENNAN